VVAGPFRVSTTTNAILIAAIGVVLLLPLGWRLAFSRLDPFEPIVVFALAWGVMFVVRPTAILIRDDTVFFGVDISGTLGRALLLALLGAVAFVVGYESSLGVRVAGRVRALQAPHDPALAVAGAVLVSVLGLLALAAFLVSAGGADAFRTFFGGRSEALNELLGESTTYLWWASLLVVPAALVAFAVALVERRPAFWATALLLFVLALVRLVPVGNRVFLLVLLGAMILLVYLRRRARPRLVSIVVAAVLALFVSSALLSFRNAESRRNLDAVAESLVSTPSRVLSPLVKGPDAEMAPALAGALQAVPDRLSHRYGGATIGDLVRRPIPRQLWKSKPDTPGHQVVAAVWPDARKYGRFDPALTPLLYFYWDFGLPGVFAGLALYGLVARSLYEYLRLHAHALGVQLLFAMGLWYLVAAVRQDPVSVFMEGAVAFLPLVVLFALASRPRHEARL
jgi:hypothetical protein